VQGGKQTREGVVDSSFHQRQSLRVRRVVRRKRKRGRRPGEKGLLYLWFLA
jgi:hypothetical protein